MKQTVEYCIYTQSTKHISTILDFYEGNNLLHLMNKSAGEIEAAVEESQNSGKIIMAPSSPPQPTADILAAIEQNRMENVAECVLDVAESFFAKNNIAGKIYHLFSTPALRFHFTDFEPNTLLVFSNVSPLIKPYLINDYIPYLKDKKCKFLLVDNIEIKCY